MNKNNKPVTGERIPARVAIANGTKYIVVGRLNDADVIQRPSGSKRYVAFPVNDGKDAIYGADRYRIVRPLSLGENFDPSKASAPETRNTWVGGQLVNADSALQVRLAEVVAERDELLAALKKTIWRFEHRNLVDVNEARAAIAKIERNYRYE
jgi:hypothetical protein